MRGPEIAAAFLVLFGIAAVVSGESGPAPDSERGPIAYIGFLRPRDGNTVDFEAGYARHLEWHRQVEDPFVWTGWTIAAGDRQRWLVYATFGHSAAAFDHRVSPAEDERDNVANIMPHAEFGGGGYYEFLPSLSRGAALGVPEPARWTELTTVDLAPGSEDAFEKSLRASPAASRGEALWYRMLAGGTVPRFLRLRSRADVESILDGANESTLPADAARLASRVSVEILSLRPTLSYGPPAAR